MSPGLNDREIAHIYHMLETLHSKVDDLNEWRWKVVGMSAAISAMVGAVIGVLL
jgi:hypothetical protein